MFGNILAESNNRIH